MFAFSFAYGATLLHFAAYGGHAGIAKILVEAKADILTAKEMWSNSKGPSIGNPIFKYIIWF